jgi:hypothetical protein
MLSSTLSRFSTVTVPTKITKLPSQAKAKPFTPDKASTRVIGCVYKMVYRTFAVHMIRNVDEFGIETYTVTTKSITGTSIYNTFYSLHMAILSAKEQFSRHGMPLKEGKPV